MELGGISAHRTVVLEGCDGVGKSTLAQQLARDFGFTIVHSARTPDGINLAERYCRHRVPPHGLRARGHNARSIPTCRSARHSIADRDAPDTLCCGGGRLPPA